jgi:OmpA-OmpF porin, OOP family
VAYRLTTQAKLFIAGVVATTGGFVLYKNPQWLGSVAPSASGTVGSNVPVVAQLPGDSPSGSTATAGVTGSFPTVTEAAPGCAGLPEVRFYLWAWNAQMGIMHATGGKQAIAGSNMCKHGVNMKLTREDDNGKLQAAMATFAEGLKKGEANPANGAHFIAIMGDGSATFLKGLNDTLAKLGPDYTAQVVGSAGFSRGEDKFMGPAEWKKNPQAARGGLVAGVLRDGDWNIALKWLGDNKIPNNPNESVYDPDALNWVGTDSFTDAGEKYIAGYCTELKNIKTGAKEKKCVNGVVTWTPGDVSVAQKKGGLVSIVSTKEYRSQMPHVIIGNKKWMKQNAKTVEGMLGAIFDSGDVIKNNDTELRQAAAVSALVYHEESAAYWYKYFNVQVEKDKTGVPVELGGSSVNNLADNLQLFGMTPGSVNAFAATYTVFGNLVKSQYPALVPSFAPVEQILDTSYLKNVAAGSNARTEADNAKFAKDQKIAEVVSRKAWDIQFASGSAQFTGTTEAQLKALLNDLVIASGTLVEIQGHTDNAGNAENNLKLSESRAFAVKSWLEKQAPSSFPEGRVKVVAKGQTEPVAENSSPAGQAKNRRVVIILGTGN